VVYKCLVCGFEHEPESIEFYNVCPECRFKSSIPKDRYAVWPKIE